MRTLIQRLHNGYGIDFDTLNATFESFLTSNKSPHHKPINIGKNKGKGRYSFVGFANKAKWETIYKQDDVLKTYSMSISASKADFVDIDENPKLVTDKITTTGTTVTLSGLKTLSDEAVSLQALEKTLLTDFSWFLYLKP